MRTTTRSHVAALRRVAHDGRRRCSPAVGTKRRREPTTPDTVELSDLPATLAAAGGRRRHHDVPRRRPSRRRRPTRPSRRPRPASTSWVDAIGSTVGDDGSSARSVEVRHGHRRHRPGARAGAGGVGRPRDVAGSLDDGRGAVRGGRPRPAPDSSTATTTAGPHRRRAADAEDPEAALAAFGFDDDCADWTAGALADEDLAGQYSVWKDCGGTRTDIVTVAVMPDDEAYTVVAPGPARHRRRRRRPRRGLPDVAVLTTIPDRVWTVLRAEPVRTLLARLDDERRRHRRVVVDAELVERLDAEVGPGERGEQVADRAVALAVAGRTPSRADADGGERVGHRQHERRARLEHAVDLAQRAAEVVVVVEACGWRRRRRSSRSARSRGRPARRGGTRRTRRPDARRAAEVGDAIGSGSRAIALAPGVGQGDGVAGDAELDDPPAAGDVAEQVQLVVAGDARRRRSRHAACPRGASVVASASRPAADRPSSTGRAWLGRLAWPGDDPVRRCAAWCGARTRPDRPPARPPAPHQRVPAQAAQPGAGVRRPPRADPGGQERRHRVDVGRARSARRTSCASSRTSSGRACRRTASASRRPRRCDALDRRRDELSAYVVEACIACHWHHLRSVLPVGGR